ncbi:MAG: 3-phosphoglycerate dehydrogenase [Bacteroidales bacterium]|jgi:D-3-phosphoglycerate dehydrogenase|nr:3-phosphoglycerate dehydrogenase [Bacteroidales bacterium]MCI2122011.1 3-phosphoglycerate dehydrogenase [Bacteroidales bacterium]MCI2145185.1 3-phosphoglycerate dehydrogenase [Bacteroidales bacterium]
MEKVLIATQKPFSKQAVEEIRSILAPEGYGLETLEKYGSEEELCDAVTDAVALIVRSDKVTAKVLEAARELKIVVRAGAGYDNLDLAACTAHGVIAMNTPGQNSNAVAELALALMVFMSRNQFNPGTGRELKGRTLGLQAYGHVGRLVAGIARGFGMKVQAFDPYLTTEQIESDGTKAVSSMDELYSTSDFVSLHIPATPETKGSIGYALISKMPKGATLVNTARKEIINEEELEKVLAEREDLKYVADVAPANYATLREKFGLRVFATPKKMGAETAEANENAGTAAARQIVGFLKHGETRFQVNR